MYKLLKLLTLLIVVAAPINHASASSITEDLSVFFFTTSSFTLSNLSFKSPSSGNFLSGFSGGTFGPGSGTVFSEIVTLDTTQTYTFSFTGSTSGGSFNGSSSLVPDGSHQSIFAGSILSGSLYAAGASVSPVPLPAGFPLFALALIALGMLGYHTSRTSRISISSRVAAAA